MSDPTPAAVAGAAAGHAQEVLTPAAIAAVLADFRAWLEQAAAQGGLALPETVLVPAPEPLDLHTFLAQLVALRHEVNLQTRASRNQQEQNAGTLDQLSQALEALRQAQAADRQRTAQNEEETLRPLLKTLVDLGDALTLAGREVQRVVQALGPTLEQLAADLPSWPGPVAPPAVSTSLWARMWGAGQPDLGPAAEAAAFRARLQERQQQARQAAERIGQLLDSILTGYTMSLQRVERALQRYGLEPVAAVGQPFDPERMEVLEAAADSGRPSGEVLDELRRGWLWRGRVFRCAQVRVAKG